MIILFLKTFISIWLFFFNIFGPTMRLIKSTFVIFVKSSSHLFIYYINNTLNDTLKSNYVSVYQFTDDASYICQFVSLNVLSLIKIQGGKFVEIFFKLKKHRKLISGNYSNIITNIVSKCLCLTTVHKPPPPTPTHTITTDSFIYGGWILITVTYLLCTKYKDIFH